MSAVVMTGREVVMGVLFFILLHVFGVFCTHGHQFYKQEEPLRCMSKALFCASPAPSPVGSAGTVSRRLAQATPCSGTVPLLLAGASPAQPRAAAGQALDLAGW